MGSKADGFRSEVGYQEPDLMILNEDGFIGTLDVYVHHARDIHNICIYHKQDVYAKLCLTSDPDVTLSTRTINGGGRNPIFGENLQLNVRTIESSLKCEIWMLSRVRNYLEDQLLGFALVPLSEVVGGRSHLKEREFSLSSTDLFHSPAGFVQLSLSYVGYSPKVSVTASSLFPLSSTVSDIPQADPDTGDSIPSEFVKIEFPDIKVVKENQLMVSEYFGIPCESLDSPCEESLITSEVDDSPHYDSIVHTDQSFSSGSVDTTGVANLDSPPSCVSVSSGHRVTIPETSQSSSSPSSGVITEATESPSSKEKSTGINTVEVESSESQISNGFSPVVKVSIEPEQTFMQQDIIDMYMKSMQQFTESLAKMKLPMDIEKDKLDGTNGKTSTEQKVQGSKENASRVFYGSRAFF